MAQLRITIPNEILEEVVLAISSHRGYDNLVNPSITRADYIKETIIRRLKNDFKLYRKNQSRIAEEQLNEESDIITNSIQ